MVSVVEVLAPTLLVIVVAVLVFLYIMAKQKERMVLIEKGIDIAQLDSKKYRHHANLRIGILLIALAVGLIIGNVITTNSLIEPFISNAIVYAVSLLLCEGIGFLVYYVLHKRLYQ